MIYDEQQRPVAVFVLSRPGRFPYHVSTLAALNEAGLHVVLVFCKGRPNQDYEGAAQEAGCGLEDFLARYPDTEVVYERDLRNTAADVAVQPSSVPLRSRVRLWVARAYRRWVRRAGASDISRWENKERKRINKQRKRIDSARWRAFRTSRYTDLSKLLHLARTYSTYLQRLPFDNFYVNRWFWFMSPRMRGWMERPWVRTVIRLEPSYRLLTMAQRILPADQALRTWLRHIGADVVFASPTNTGNAPEACYVKAANAEAIPTLVPVMSWDNLSTKGLVQFPPTALLAWGRQHEEEGHDIHRLAQRSIVRVGSPFFDKWYDADALYQDRETFFATMGMDPEKPMVLYLGSSQNIARNEGWLTREVVEEMRRIPETADLQVVVRSHPSNVNLFEDLEGLDGVFTNSTGIPVARSGISLLYNLIFHSIAVVGINTSAMVDAIVIGRPCFSVKTDRYVDTHLESEHFNALLNSGALSFEDNVPKLVESLAGVLAGKQVRVEERARFITDFCRPFGPEISAGEASAFLALRLTEGLSISDAYQRLIEYAGTVAPADLTNDA